MCRGKDSRAAQECGEHDTPVDVNNPHIGACCSYPTVCCRLSPVPATWAPSRAASWWPSCRPAAHTSCEWCIAPGAGPPACCWARMHQLPCYAYCHAYCRAYPAAAAANFGFTAATHPPTPCCPPSPSPINNLQEPDRLGHARVPGGRHAVLLGKLVAGAGGGAATPAVSQPASQARTGHLTRLLTLRCRCLLTLLCPLPFRRCPRSANCCSWA